MKGVGIGLPKCCVGGPTLTTLIWPTPQRYREYRLVSFLWQFELGEWIDQEGIGADLRHGVLTLTLPKAAKAQARAITVNAA